MFHHTYIEPNIYGFNHVKLAKVIQAQIEQLIKVGFTTKTASQRISQWRRTEGYDCINHVFDFIPKIEITDDNDIKHTTYVHDTAFHKLLMEQGKCQHCQNNKYTRLLDIFKLDNDYATNTRSSLNVDGTFNPSQEFFIKTCVCDDSVTAPITKDLMLNFMYNEITEDYRKSINDPAYKPKYTYSTDEGNFLTKELHFSPVKDFSPRGYQGKAIQQIVERMNNKSIFDVLLWSPTRSGKSAIAAWVMNEICTKEDT